MLKYLVCTALAIGAMTAQATLISGDFRTESNLPTSGSGQPLVYESLNQSIGAGYELTGADFVQNPSGWGGGEVWMDFNPATNVLTLDSQDIWDFYTFDAWISNIAFGTPGEQITGIQVLTNDLTTPVVIPSLFFSADSIHISYSADIFNFTGGLATFQILTSTSAAVPEPATLALLGLGLAGIAARRKFAA